MKKGQTGFSLPLKHAKFGLKQLKDAGMRKINLAGGEPTIVDQGHYAGELIRYAK